MSIGSFSNIPTVGGSSASSSAPIVQLDQFLNVANRYGISDDNARDVYDRRAGSDNQLNRGELKTAISDLTQAFLQS